jgi:hypothetical protein
MTKNWTPLAYPGKTWIYTAQAVLFGGLGGFAIVLGPLLLNGAIRPAHGDPGTSAGIALTVMSLPLLLVFAGAVSRHRAHRKPVLRCYRQGIEFDRIGDSSKRTLLVPPLFFVLWSHVTGRAFQRQILRLAWSEMHEVTVIGMPMARELFIRGEWRLGQNQTDKMFDAGLNEARHSLPALAIPEVTFVRRLSDIATEIETVANNVRLQQELPPWSNES